MNLEKWLEKGIIPDFLVRAGIRRRLASRLREEETAGKSAGERLQDFIAALKKSPIALHTREANEQHYEVPASFFRIVLGRHMKYSCGYWPAGVNSLDASEEAMLDLYVQRARLSDGQGVLELGCGWGSLSLYIASRFPHSSVTAVSNSSTQKAFIEQEAARRDISNIRVITADMNTFETDSRFDRIVSVEMFEHMRNYEKLLEKTASWLKPDGLLFVHIFAHERFAYPFEVRSEKDWMARYFFTGGVMPSRELLLHFQKHVKLLESWTVDGRHYQKTCEAWLARMDENEKRIMKLFREVYGTGAQKWFSWWRIFFMACAELFGYRGGREWIVVHYLFARQQAENGGAGGGLLSAGAGGRSGG